MLVSPTPWGQGLCTLISGCTDLEKDHQNKVVEDVFSLPNEQSSSLGGDQGKWVDQGFWSVVAQEMQTRCEAGK